METVYTVVNRQRVMQLLLHAVNGKSVGENALGKTNMKFKAGSAAAAAAAFEATAIAVFIYFF